MRLKTIGVLGAGNIGIGVVTDLVLHGITAVVVDTSDGLLKHAQVEVLNNIRFAPLFSSTLPRISNDEAMQRIVLTTDLGKVASCDFIIENVTEDWNIKRQLYEGLDRVAPPEVCFGANTSCISITKIAGAIVAADLRLLAGDRLEEGPHFVMPPANAAFRSHEVRNQRALDCAVRSIQRKQLLGIVV